MNHRAELESQITVSSMLAIMAGSLLVLGLVSCADVTGPGYVEKQWVSKIRELGIIPIFPPREDVQVGDVYVLPSSPESFEQSLDKKGFVPMSSWACQLNLRKALTKFYASRASFPFTGTNLPSEMSSMTNNPFTLIGQDRASSSIYESGDTGRLRLVGFPQFMSATFTQGDLSALIPIEAISLSLGTTFSSQKAATVSVPVAESYGVPGAIIQPLLKTGPLNQADNTPIDWKQFTSLAPEGGQFRDSSGRVFVYAIAISEVFYTRAIDISIQAQEGSATALQATVTGGQQAEAAAKGLGNLTGTTTSTNTTGATNTASTGTTTTTGSTNTTTTTTTPFLSNLTDPVAQANALNARNSANLSSMLTPGGRINFVSVSAAGVSMRRTYSSPIAIGYRGIVITIDDEGNVVQVGSTQKNNPLFYLDNQ